MNELLRFDRVSFTYPGGTQALRSLQLSLHEGEYIVLTGPNGAGKSALLRCANGLLTPQQGRVLHRGRDIRADLPATRRAVALLFQETDDQFVAGTVADDVAFGPENAELPPELIEKRVEGALAAMEVGHLRRADPLQLSGGEKRRVALAGLLALEPEIIFLDEPFVSLDYRGVRSVLAAMRRLRESGIAVVAVTHAVEKVAAEASRMILMDAGALIADGTPQEVLPIAESHGLPPVPGPPEELTWLR
jgi:biotin transport system ATP-binding protein